MAVPATPGRRRRPGWAAATAVACAAALAGCAAPPEPAAPPRTAGPAVSSAPLALVEPGGDARPGRSAAPELIDGPALPRAEPVGLAIPALDLRTDRLVPLGLQPDGAMQVPAGAAVVGWYTGAPAPGSLGPAVLAAHVDWEGEPGPFHDLHELRPGDEVAVARADGSVARFRVTRVERHPKDAFPTEAVYGTIDHAGLRLITCGGEFDERADSYRDNVIGYAELVGSSAP